MQPLHQRWQTLLAVIDWDYYRTGWFGVVVFHYPRPNLFIFLMLA